MHTSVLVSVFNARQASLENPEPSFIQRLISQMSSLLIRDCFLFNGNSVFSARTATMWWGSKGITGLKPQLREGFFLVRAMGCVWGCLFSFCVMFPNETGLQFKLVEMTTGVLQLILMQQERAQKQEYLREEILDKGYSPEGFLEFLTSLKQGGQDLDFWSFPELMGIVGKYRHLQQQATHNNDTSKDETEGQGKGQQSQRRVRECRKFERFIDRDLVGMEIVIDKPEIVTTGGFMGFGSTSVLWYCIKTPIVQNEVKRLDEDFDWLRLTLVRLYPHKVIPPLQPSRPISTDDTKALFKRGQMLRHFFQNLSKCQMLINCKLTVSFLTWGDYPRFEIFKREQTTIITPISPEEFVTESGRVDLVMNEENQQVAREITTYNTGIKSIYDEIREAIKSAMKNLDDLTASIYRIGNCFASMQEKHSNLTTNVPELADQPLNDLIVGLNNCAIEWGRAFHSRRKSLEKHLSPLFKFASEEATAVGESLKKRARLEEDAQKYSQNLERKKEKVFPYPEKWNVPAATLAKIQISNLPKNQVLKQIFPVQTRNCINMSDMVGGLNSSCESEFRRMQPLIRERLIQAFKGLGNSLLESTKSEIEVITRFSNGEY